MKLNISQAKLAQELIVAEKRPLRRIQMVRDLVNWATGEIAPYGRLEDIARLGQPDDTGPVGRRGWDTPTLTWENVPPLPDADYDTPPESRNERTDRAAGIRDEELANRRALHRTDRMVEPHFTDPGDRKPGRTA